MCVCGGGGGGVEAIIKLKGAGATHALPRSYLHVSILLCASFHINLPPIQKFSRHEGLGPSEKASLGGQASGSAN